MVIERLPAGRKFYRMVYRKAARRANILQNGYRKAARNNNNNNDNDNNNNM
jgi:hypothetical protein